MRPLFSDIFQKFKMIIRIYFSKIKVHFLKVILATKNISYFLLRFIGIKKLISILSTILFVFVYAVIFKPIVNVTFNNYTGPQGYGSVWEAIIDVNEGRPFDISNLYVNFQFPSNISKIINKSSGGCEGLEEHIDEIVRSKGFHYNNTDKSKGRIFAKNCRHGSKVIYQFELQSPSCQDELSEDTGKYSSEFNWKILNIGDVPWSSIDKWLNLGSKLDGLIPASEQEALYIPIKGFSRVVLDAPFYDLRKHEGKVLIFMEAEDFNNQLKLNDTIFGFCRPSTRFKLFSKNNAIIGARIHWVYCKIPFEFETQVDKVNIDEFKREGFGISIEVTWKDRSAELKIRKAKLIRENNNTDTIVTFPEIIRQAFCQVSI